MKAATAKEMRLIDSSAIKKYGMPGRVLMERAGLAVVAHIEDDFPDISRVLVLAGPGNNAGDGLVVARELANRGYSASVLMACKRESLSPDCRAQLKIAEAFGVPVGFGYSPRPVQMHGALIVDALLGTGLTRPVSGQLKRTIEAINSSGRPVISVDIPSGICSDTGRVMGAAVVADATVTFGAMKRGHLLYPGAGHSGEIHVHDIGLPSQLMASISCNMLEMEQAALLMPERSPDSHKGDFGHLLVLAGSRGKAGAAFMAAGAALRTGAGLVTMAAPGGLADIWQGRATEEMVLPLSGTAGGSLAHSSLRDILEFASTKATAIVAGPGLSMDRSTVRLIRELAVQSPVPLVLDADAINALGQDAAEVLGMSRSAAALTPHPGEMARITGMSVADIQADRPAAALGLAIASGTCVALKGAPTVIAGPEGELFINPTGGPALSKAGTGDVLAGMAGAFAAMGMGLLESLVLSSYVHGLAGDLAAQELNESSVIASDVIGLIPQAFSLILGDAD